MTYKLPDLPYDYADLEPVISEEIMKLHHSKHHNGYVNNLNTALEKFKSAEKAGDVDGMIAAGEAIRFNGGGHVNHSIFWTNLAPEGKGGGGKPSGELLAAIEEKWGSFEVFQEIFNARTVAVKGSGWGWLGYHTGSKRLCIHTCSNQDPLSMIGLVPLLGVDVWEHAYYLQYKNVRGDYLKNIWKIINWKNVEERFKNSK